MVADIIVFMGQDIIGGIPVKKPVNVYLVYYGSLGPAGGLKAGTYGEAVGLIGVLYRTPQIVTAYLVAGPYLKVIPDRFIIKLDPALVKVKRVDRVSLGHKHPLPVADKEYVVGIALTATSALLFFGGKKRRPVKIIDGKRYRKKLRKNYGPLDAVIVGFTQCAAALLPGLSRSGSTLTAGQLRGIDRQSALDFSFLLGTPAIVAAALLELKDVLFSDEGGVNDINFVYVLVGMVVAGVVGFLAIKLFKWLLTTNKMFIFILYTAAVGLVIILISIIELSSGTNLFTQQPLHF